MLLFDPFDIVWAYNIKNKSREENLLNCMIVERLGKIKCYTLALSILVQFLWQNRGVFEQNWHTVKNFNYKLHILKCF